MATDITRAYVARLVRDARSDFRAFKDWHQRHNNTPRRLADKAIADLFAAFAWPGGYPIAYYVSERDQLTGDVLCADCARNLVMDDRGAVCADIYYEGPSQYCADCNREIESAYGDPDGDESDFQAALEGQSSFTLVDEGTIETALRCNACDTVHRFSERSAATDFLTNDLDCWNCDDQPDEDAETSGPQIVIWL